MEVPLGHLRTELQKTENEDPENQTAVGSVRRRPSAISTNLDAIDANDDGIITATEWKEYIEDKHLKKEPIMQQLRGKYFIFPITVIQFITSCIGLGLDKGSDHHDCNLDGMQDALKFCSKECGQSSKKSRQ